jgi:2-C-methyl-D-erythritol 4-phosphate cytidylyltransferase
MNVGILVAGGRGERMGAKVDKAFLSLGPRPVLAYSMIAFEHCDDIDEVVIVVRRERVDAAWSMARMFGCAKVTAVIPGGAKRQVSVSNGLAACPAHTSIVSVHDGARPCITPEIISDTVKTAKRYGSGIAAVKVTDTMKYVERGYVVTKTVPREKLWAVQTPQSFKYDLLQKALSHVKKENVTVTDEASAVELVTDGVRLVPSAASNIKVTAADDLLIAAALLKL